MTNLNDNMQHAIRVLICRWNGSFSKSILETFLPYHRWEKRRDKPVKPNIRRQNSVIQLDDQSTLRWAMAQTDYFGHWTNATKRAELSYMSCSGPVRYGLKN